LFADWYLQEFDANIFGRVYGTFVAPDELDFATDCKSPYLVEHAHGQERLLGLDVEVQHVLSE
jgi:hypothetical protein